MKPTTVCRVKATDAPAAVAVRPRLCVASTSRSGTACCSRRVAAAAASEQDGSSSSLESTSGAQRMMETGLTRDGQRLTSKAVSTLKVRDIMTSPAYSIPPDMSVFDAMTILVDKRVSGLPVTDGNNKVIGMCSGYDLLALDSTPGKLDKSYFPPINKCITEFGGDRKLMWSNFKELRRKIRTANCDTVGQVMHSAFIVGMNADLEEAADLVVQRRAHRICVVDDDGKLAGIVSRGDIMRATIANFDVYMRAEDRKALDGAPAPPA